MASRINFSWQAAQNVETYELWELKPGDADFTEAILGINEPQFSLLMDGFVEGNYHYKVRGVNQFGEGPFSEPVTVNFILPTQVVGLDFTIV